MKKLLMLSAGLFEIPLIREAQAQGYYVITTGNNEAAPGHEAADMYAPHDYSDYDGMVELAKRLEIDVISQGCSDNCALTASYMGEKLGLKGHDTFRNAQIIHRKDHFKRFAAECGLKTPTARYFESEEDALKTETNRRFPLIIKPTDQAGGKGVTRVYSEEEYRRAIHYAFDRSGENRIVVEPYIEGTLHSLSTFLVDRRVAFYATLNDYSYANRFMTNSGVAPAEHWQKAVDFLIPQTELTAEKLGLTDGLLHMQYIMSGDEFWIIEMMRRTPGNNYMTAASHSTGINWLEWIIRAEAGEECRKIPQTKISERYYGYHAVMSDRNGIFGGVEIADEFRDKITEWEQYDPEGTVIDDYLYQKFGLAQYSFASKEEKDRYMPRINEMIRCRLREK